MLNLQRGARVDKSRLKQIEDRDARLAQIMYEQERLRAQRKKQAKREQLAAAQSAGHSHGQVSRSSHRIRKIVNYMFVWHPACYLHGSSIWISVNFAIEFVFLISAFIIYINIHRFKDDN